MFFCVTIWSVENNNDIAGYDLEATGYFILMLIIPIWIGIKLFATPMNQTQIKIDLIIAIIINLFILFIVFGYFALAGRSTNIEGSGGYWVGFAFYILSQGIFIGIDMSFERYLPFTQHINNNDSNNLQQYMLAKQGSMY